MRSEANSAPNTSHAVDALNASKALSEATHFCAELDELHELRTRVDELESALKLAYEDLKLAYADADDQAEKLGHVIRERDDLMTDLALTNAEFGQTSERLQAERDELRERADDYRFERNNLASDLADLREAHQHTVAELARARRERDTLSARYKGSGW